MEDLKLQLKKYIVENYIEEPFEFEDSCDVEDRADYSCGFFGFQYSAAGAVPDFNMILEKNVGETFSEMLTRLIEESGEKNSVIYNRANIDRRLFSKIVNHIDYKPAKNTVLAFAVALKLSYEMTQKLLDAAGFTLNKKNLADVIITFFIENKIFDIDVINNYLHEYKQPLIGGGQKFCRLADDQT